MTDWKAIAEQDKKAGRFSGKQGEGTDWGSQVPKAPPDPLEDKPYLRRFHQSFDQLAGDMLPGLTFDDFAHPNVARTASHVLPAALKAMAQPGAATQAAPQNIAGRQGMSVWNAITDSPIGGTVEKAINALGDPAPIPKPVIDAIKVGNPAMGFALEKLYNERWAGRHHQAGRDVGDVATMIAAPPGMAGEKVAAEMSRSEALEKLIAGMPKPENSTQAAHQAAALRLMNDHGVRLRPGSAAGGRTMEAERKAIDEDQYKGPALHRAAVREVEDFNRAAYNEALSHIGESLTEDEAVGHTAFAKTKQAFNDFYDKWLAKAKALNDPTFDKEMSALIEKVPLSKKDEFRQAINNIVTDVFKSRKFMTGPEFKEVQRTLRKEGQTYIAGVGADRKMGQALLDAETLLREALARGSPPEVVKALKEADVGFAKYSRIKDAVVAAKHESGVFVPRDLTNALAAARGRSGKLVRDTFAAGNSFMQKLAQDAEKVVGNDAFRPPPAEKETSWEKRAKEFLGASVGAPLAYLVAHGIAPESSIDLSLVPAGGTIGGILANRLGKARRVRKGAEAEAALLREMGHPPDPYLKRVLNSPRLVPTDRDVLHAAPLTAAAVGQRKMSDRQREEERRRAAVQQQMQQQVTEGQ